MSNLNRTLGQKLSWKTQVRWAFDRPWLRVLVSAVLILLVVGADQVQFDQEEIEMALLAIR